MLYVSNRHPDECQDLLDNTQILIKIPFVHSWPNFLSLGATLSL
jgi:hypothetical protein